MEERSPFIRSGVGDLGVSVYFRYELLPLKLDDIS
jgi:hypothetical protein